MATIIEVDDQLEVVEPMAPDHFDITISRMRLRKKEIIEACRRVLVEEQKNTRVETELGVKQAHLSLTCKNITAKWEEIVAKAGWVVRPIALSDEEMGVVLALQKRSMASLEKTKKSPKKKPPKKKP